MVMDAGVSLMGRRTASTPGRTHLPLGTAHARAASPKGRCRMLDLLWVLAGVFLLMWVIGLSVSVNVGAFIHVLLVLALASMLIRIILGRRVV
jgi:hypothetical protein